MQNPMLYETWNDIIDYVIQCARYHQTDSSKITIVKGDGTEKLFYFRGSLVAQLFHIDDIPF